MCVLDSSTFVLDVLWMFVNLLKMRSRCLYSSVALRWFYLVCEAVADAGNGQDELRAFRNWFDFLAQLRHVDMQAVRLGVRLGPPDLVQQHLPRENLAAVGDEDFEQVVLGGG